MSLNQSDIYIMDKDKEKSAVESFLEGTENEQNLFGATSKDPFTKPEVVEQKEEEEKEEKALPFHKDPKVQKYLDKQIAKALESVKGSEVEKSEKIQSSDYEEVVNAFTTVIGNDTPEKVNALSALKKALEGADQRATQKALERVEALEQQEIQADRQAEEELESAFENIEENYGVDISSNNSLAKKTRQEFVSFIERIAPKDREGNVIDYPDMTSAWETFSELKKATPSRAKELASRSMARSSEASPTQQQKRVDWNAVNEFMDTLKS